MPPNKESICWNDILNCRLEIFALAAIWIILFHLQMYTGWKSNNIVAVMIQKFLGAGASGVDIFLFFSGAGLFYSMKKNTIKEFYRNRFLRIAFSYFSIAGCYYFWDNFIYTKEGVLSYLLDLSTITWWISEEGALWYMSFIVVLYLIFPLLFSWNQKTNSKSTLCIIIGFMLISVFFSVKGLRIPFNILDMRYEKFISRVPIFMLGLYTAGNLEKSERVPIKSLIYFTVMSGGALIIAKMCPWLGVKIFKRWCNGLLALCLAYLYVWQKNRQILAIIPHVGIGLSETVCRLLKIIGKYSLEVYLIHLCILRAIDAYNVWTSLPWYIWWLMVVAVTYMITWVISKLRKLAMLCMKFYRRQT